MDKSLLLRASVKGQDALLMLNGMVLGKLTVGQELRLPVHEYIQSGENRIQVEAISSTAQNGAKPLSACNVDAQVLVEIQKDRGPGSFVNANVLFRLQGSVLRGQRFNKNRVLDTRVDLPVSFPRWRYLDVMQSPADSDDQERIQDFLLKMLTLFQGQKVSALLPYFSVRNREVATAYGLDLQQVHSTFASHLEQMCTHCTLNDKALDPAQWLVRPVRQSSIYALLNPEHQPLLQFNANQSGTLHKWPMHVGVLGSEVFVLR
ncbi:hypothetical protein [Limnobacter sp.]|uniref:hypothetical protein n=1 Tax=Limnobacter sp. TaxID=2003368 RepID=UPI002FDF7BA0